MFDTLLFLHSITRWAVVLSLAYALYRAVQGRFQKRPFTQADNALRHWTATIAHVQLVLGILLYVQRPLTGYFWSHFQESITDLTISFFGFWHMLLMVAAIVVLTIGSAKAKRQTTDPARFQTMLVWFAVALLIILVAIPWPFSPFAQRPYFPNT